MSAIEEEQYLDFQKAKMVQCAQRIAELTTEWQTAHDRIEDELIATSTLYNQVATLYGRGIWARYKRQNPNCPLDYETAMKIIEKNPFDAGKIMLVEGVSTSSETSTRTEPVSESPQPQASPSEEV